MQIKNQFEMEDKKVTLWTKDKENLPLIVLNNYDDDGKDIYTEITGTGFEFSLLNIESKEENWNRDLSPWPCQSLYRNTQDFLGDANTYLELLIKKIMLKTLSILKGEPEYMGIAGYSLAGLFALYSMYKTKVFQKVACISGSLWYPNFVEFAKSHKYTKPEKIFISLGNKEHKTRHPIVREVASCTDELVRFFSSEGIDTTFVRTNGNHFANPSKRTIEGIKNLLMTSTEAVE